MADLAAFLAARLDDDEEYLRIVVGSIPYQRATAEQAEISPELRAAVMSLMSRPDLQALSARWAESGVRPPNDLERALREVAAKRAILAAHPAITYERFPDWPPRCRTCITNRSAYRENWEFDPWPCTTLRALAAVYSGHPDYDPAWAVQPPP